MIRTIQQAFLVTLIATLFLGQPIKAEVTIEIKADLGKDETLRVFPTYASINSKNIVTAKIRAWAYEMEHHSHVRKAAISALKNLFGLSSIVLDEKIFALRVQYFLVDNERNKTVTVFHRNNELKKGDTDASGQVVLDIQWANTLKQPKHPLWIKTKVTPSPPAHETSSNEDVIQLIPAQGRSVISDIDDTIKLTGALSKSELLERTFGKPFEEVAEMSDLYRKLANEQGASFHYVSSSPWQLQPEIQSFLTTKKFPLGSFHLKSFRLKDSHVLNMFSDPVPYKTEIIESILSDLPCRDFFLIGDSGEKDPEIYADIAKRFPNRISAIFIRLVPTHKMDDPRFKAVFSGIEKTKWQLFEKASALQI